MAERYPHPLAGARQAPAPPPPARERWVLPSGLDLAAFALATSCAVQPLLAVERAREGALGRKQA